MILNMARLAKCSIQLVVFLSLVTLPISGSSWSADHKFGNVSVWMTYNLGGSVFHMENDVFKPGSILFSTTHKLESTNGHQKELVVGEYSLIVSGRYQEGTGAKAHFSHITSFAQMNISSVIVADFMNYCLRYIDRNTQSTSPFVGKCTRSGYKDGQQDVQFVNPYDVLMVNSTTLFVSDRHRLRVVNINTRHVSTLFSQQNKQAWIYGPTIDPQSSDFLHFISEFSIMKLTISTGSVSYLVGPWAQGFQDGPIATAKFEKHSRGLKIISSGVLLVVDSFNNRIRLVDLKSGQVQSICSGIPGKIGGLVNDCQLDFPFSVLPLDNYIYIGDKRGIYQLSILDVGKCETEVKNCNENAQCIDIPGEGYMCQCLPGFSGDGMSCTDVDECRKGEDNCHKHAVCSNTLGSFNCQCIHGYPGDGVTCLDERASRVVESIEGDVSSFVFSRGIYNSLSEFSLCMWLDLSTATHFSNKYLLHYALPGKANEFSMSFDSSSWIVFYKGVKKHILMSVQDFNTLRRWRKHCWTLTTTETSHVINWYMEAEDTMKFVLFQSVSITGTDKIAANGVMIFLQGNAVGRYRDQQVLGGRASWINMWNRAFTALNMDKLSCQDTGDVVNMVHMGATGNPFSKTLTSPCAEIEARNRSLIIYSDYLVPACNQLTGLSLHVISTTAKSHSADIKAICGCEVFSGPELNCLDDKTLRVTWTTGMVFPPSQNSIPQNLSSSLSTEIRNRQNVRPGYYLGITVLISIPPLVHPLQNSNGFVLTAALTERCGSTRQFNSVTGKCATIGEYI